MVQIIDDAVHNEHCLVVNVFLRCVGGPLFELSSPLFLNIKRFLVILDGFEVSIKESLKLLSIMFLTKTLFHYTWEELVVILWD